MASTSKAGRSSATAKSGAAKVPELPWQRTVALIPYFADERLLTEASADLGIDVVQIREALDFLGTLDRSGVVANTAFTVTVKGMSAQVTPNVDWPAMPVRLTPEELSAMLLTLETLESAPMLRDADVVRSAATKLRSGAALGRIAVTDATTQDPAPDGTTPLDPARADVLRTVRGAIASATVLDIDYRTASGRRSLRSVDPVSLVMIEGEPYLRAVDRDEAGAVIKSFRIDRMLGATDTGEKARWHGSPDFDSGDPHGFLSDTTTWAAVTVDADATWVADYEPLAFAHDADDDDFPAGGPYPAWVPAANADRTIGFLLRRWPGVKAVEPVSLPKAVADRARAGLRAYGETPTCGDGGGTGQ